MNQELVEVLKRINFHIAVIAVILLVGLLLLSIK